MGALNNPVRVGPEKLALLESEGLRWLDQGDMWMDFRRRKAFRYRYVLDAEIERLRAAIATERRGVWQVYGSPLVPGEWKRIRMIGEVRRGRGGGRGRVTPPTSAPCKPRAGGRMMAPGGSPMGALRDLNNLDAAKRALLSSRGYNYISDSDVFAKRGKIFSYEWAERHGLGELREAIDRTPHQEWDIFFNDTPKPAVIEKIIGKLAPLV